MKWFAVAVLAMSFSSAAQAQLFFEADAVFLNRSGGIGGGSLISGSNSVSTSGLNTGYEPGYRLNFGAQLLEYQVDASFTQVSPWQDAISGGIPNIVILDDTAGIAIVDPGMLANRIVIPNGLFDASTLPAELSESERLRGGSVWSYTDRANYHDFEINMGTARDAAPWRFSVGYRHIQYDGRSRFALAGVFDAIDTDDAAVFGGITNDPNDALLSASFTDPKVGFTTLSGGGDFDAFDTMDGPDTLIYSSTGRADNALHGAQATFAMRLLDGAWVTLEGTAKAGLYQNNLRGSVTEGVVGTGNASLALQRSFVSKKVSAAFAGNLGLRAVISLTDYINLVGGYEVTFLSGIGLAGDQVHGLTTDLGTGMRVFDAVNTGDVVLHGGTAGLEVTW
ncbi:MAG: hypothetical protein KDA66_00560 [Planctomycetaceae bacterium]|nr:hypothetical protein [Planctomycetaceae bacterium]